MAAAHENQLNHPSTFQFLVNPSAGKGKYNQIIQIIQHALSDSGVKYDITVLRYKGEAISLAREAARVCDAVVAVGGDGTVNEVFNGLVGTNAVFGIIPAGTGNGFARGIGIPLRIEYACRLLVEGCVKAIDVGLANDRYFLGTAGLGFDAMIAAFAGKKLGKLRGMWLYFYAGALTFLKYSPQLMNLKMDSASVEVKPLLIAIANTKRYGGNALIAPDALPDDGLFDICIIEDMGALELVWHLPKLFKGTHIRLSKVLIYKAKNIVVDASEPVPMHVDGEAIGSYSKMQFKLLSRAIKILAPENPMG